MVSKYVFQVNARAGKVFDSIFLIAPGSMIRIRCYLVKVMLFWKKVHFVFLTSTQIYKRPLPLCGCHVCLV